MESAERILKLSELITQAMTQAFELEDAPEEFTMQELTTGAVLSVMGIGQMFLLEEGNEKVLTLEDIVTVVEEGLESVAKYVIGEPTVE